MSWNYHQKQKLMSKNEAWHTHYPGTWKVKIFMPIDMLYTKRTVCSLFSSIPGMCDFKSVHGGKKELFHFLWFLMQKYGLKLMVFKVSSPVNSLFMTILIEWMFPQDGQILVHGFRNQIFWIWTIFGWVIAFLVKINSKIIINAVKEAK